MEQLEHANNTELIAKLTGKPAAEELLKQYGGLTNLAQASFDELQMVKGIGQSKAAAVKSAFLLAQRLSRESYAETPTTDTEQQTNSANPHPATVEARHPAAKPLPASAKLRPPSEKLCRPAAKCYPPTPKAYPPTAKPRPATQKPCPPTVTTYPPTAKSRRSTAKSNPPMPKPCQHIQKSWPATDISR